MLRPGAQVHLLTKQLEVVLVLPVLCLIGPRVNQHTALSAGGVITRIPAWHGV